MARPAAKAKVTALEPGGMRTGWGAEARCEIPNMLADYEPSVGVTPQRVRGAGER
jgi:hypothetical protein